MADARNEGMDMDMDNHEEKPISLPRFPDKVKRPTKRPPADDDNSMHVDGNHGNAQQPPSFPAQPSKANLVQDQQAFGFTALLRSLNDGSSQDVARIELEHAFGHAQAATRAQLDEAKVQRSFGGLAVTPKLHVDLSLSRTNLSSRRLVRLRRGMRATEEMMDTLRKCHEAADHWANDWAVDHFREFARTRKAVLHNFCRSLFWMTEVLHLARQGWDFTKWAEMTLADTNRLLGELSSTLERLADYEGCAWLRREAGRNVEAMVEKVGTIVKQKKAEEEWSDRVLERELEKALAE